MVFLRKKYFFFSFNQLVNFKKFSTQTLSSIFYPFYTKDLIKYDKATVFNIEFKGSYRKYLFSSQFLFFKHHFSSKSSFTNSTATSCDLSKTVDETLNQEEAPLEMVSEIAIHKIGDLKAMGFCHWTPVGFLQQCLEYIHVFTGLPWWASIAILTVIIRSSMVPFLIGMIRNLSTLAYIHPQVQEHMKALKEAQLQGDLIEQAKHTRSIQDLFKEYQVNPFKSLAMPFIQMPVFISFYLACSRMAALPVPELKYGGLGWFKDLSTSDSYFILPFLNSSLMFINFKLGSEVGSDALANSTAKMRNFFRIMILLTPLFTMNFQSAVFCYWITSNLFSLGQGIMLRNPAIRNFLNLPPIRQKVKFEKDQNDKGVSGGFKSNFMTIVEGIKNTHRQVIEATQETSRKLTKSSKENYLRPVDKTLEAYMLKKKEKYKAKQEGTS